MVAVSNISGSKVYISGGSVNVSSISGDAYDPKNERNQRVYLGKLYMPDAVGLWVDNVSYGITANHASNDTLYLYMQHAGASDNRHTVDILLRNGTLYTCSAEFYGIDKFIFNLPPTIMPRVNTHFNVLSSFETQYRTPYNSNYEFRALLEASGGAANSEDLNSAFFNEYIITLNNQIQAKQILPDNMLPSLNLTLNTMGLPVGRYPISMEYGGSRENLPCKVDTFLAIVKADPYLPNPVERTLIYGQRLREAMPPLVPDTAWFWLNPDSMLTTIGTGQHQALYIPYPDTANLRTIIVQLPVRVNKAAPIPPAIDLVLSARCGDTLKSVELPLGWLWEHPDTLMTELGNQIYSAQYIPEDTIHYRTLHTNLNILVSRGKPNPDIPTGLRGQYGSLLSTVDLQDTCWKWFNPDQRMNRLGNRTYNAIYKPSDTIRYDTIIRKLIVEIPKPKDLIKLYVTNATEDLGSERSERYFKIHDCNTDTVNIRFEAPVGIKIYPLNSLDTLSSISMVVNRPNIYLYPFNINAPDTTWTETLLLERPFAFKDIVVQKANRILFVNNRSEVNGGYTFSDYRWFLGDELIGEGQYYESPSDAMLSDAREPYRVELNMVLSTDDYIIHTCSDTIKESIISGGKLRVFPNPAATESQLTFAIPDEWKSRLLALKVDIFNTHGTLLSTCAVPADNPTFHISLPPGIYILKTEIGDVRLAVMER
jgi:hypothetical protein